MKRKYSWLLFLFLLIFSSAPLMAYETSKVIRVFDGDAIQITGERNVHLTGVDAPEAIQDGKLYQDANHYGLDIYKTMGLGKSSKLFLRRILQDKEVRLEFDENEQDKKGPRRAYVYLPVCKGKCEYQPAEGYEYATLDDGVYVFVNATMLKSGFARVEEATPNLKHKELFMKLEKEAVDNGRGFRARRT